MLNRIKLPEWLNDVTHIFASPDPYQVVGSILLILMGYIFTRVSNRFINSQFDDTNRRHVFRKLVNYSTTTIVLLILIFLWIRNLTYLTAITGFLAAGIAIAMRDVIMSLFGWIKIIWTRPFNVGDRIQVQSIEGDIIDITPLHTVILEVGNWIDANQSTGRIVFIPNNVIFLESVFNSTLGFPYLWDEFSIVLTFESDIDKARSIIGDQLDDIIGINYRRARQEIQKMGDRYAIQYNNLGARVYTSIEDNGVKMTMRYLTRVRGRREVNSRLSKKVLALINETDDVELAYPTYRIYREGESIEKSSDRDK